MNQLQHLDEFQVALDSYHLSADAKNTLAKTKLVIMLGPTGGGRNTIIAELLKTNEYYFIVSDTTRQPRANNGVMEQNGREYWFRTEADMLADIIAGKFLEAEIIHGQQVSGVSIRELSAAEEQSKTALTDADIGGVQNVLRLKPDTIAVLVLPPSFVDWQQRLNKRGEMPPEELKRRLQTAQAVFGIGLQDTRLHIIVNDSYEQAAASVHQIARGMIQDPAILTANRKLCKELLDETTTFLTTL